MGRTLHKASEGRGSIVKKKKKKSIYLYTSIPLKSFCAYVVPYILSPFIPSFILCALSISPSKDYLAFDLSI